MNLTALSRRRWQIAGALSIAIVALYFGFVLLIAFDKTLVAHILVPGLSVGILMGALVIVASWVATWAYVRWADAHLDRHVARLRGARRHS
jgi:uncharacterized membrane protein (DUF485 family)